MVLGNNKEGLFRFAFLIRKDIEKKTSEKEAIMFKPEILICGDRAVTVRIGDKIEQETGKRVQTLFSSLAKKNINGITELIPAFCSLTVCYDPERISYKKLCRIILGESGLQSNSTLEKKKIHHIPVLYGGNFGPDLSDVARLSGLSEHEVVKRHTAPDYMIYMLGFLPGFPYLGGLDKSIETPRLESPRTSIPRGSVGIGGSQTGIYPIESPGGWRLIGRTPILPYDPSRTPPVLYEAGDFIRFVPISVGEYEKIEREVADGSYKHTVTEE